MRLVVLYCVPSNPQLPVSLFCPPWSTCKHAPRHVQDGERGPERPQSDPRCFQDGPKWTQYGPRWPQYGPRDGLKCDPRWFQGGLARHLEPNRRLRKGPQEAPRGPLTAPSRFHPRYPPPPSSSLSCSCRRGLGYKEAVEQMRNTKGLRSFRLPSSVCTYMYVTTSARMCIHAHTAATVPWHIM